MAKVIINQAPHRAVRYAKGTSSSNTHTLRRVRTAIHTLARRRQSATLLLNRAFTFMLGGGAGGKRSVCGVCEAFAGRVLN